MMYASWSVFGSYAFLKCARIFWHPNGPREVIYITRYVQCHEPVMAAKVLILLNNVP